MACIFWLLMRVTYLLTITLPMMDGYSDEDVNAYMQLKMADYKVGLHKATQTRPKRVRREVTTQDFTMNTTTGIAQMSDIANITPWQSIPTSYPVELEPFIINTDNYMAVVNFKAKNGEYRTNSAVYILNGTEFRLLQNFSTSGGIDFEFANLGRQQFAIFLDHVGQNWYGGTDRYTYMKSFQVNQFLPSEGHDKPFQYRTKVRALGAKKVKVFTKDNKHYFVTANSYHKMGNLYHVKSTMHVQTAYGYQLVQEFHTQGAQDVEVVVIGGRRYIFFANKMDNAGKVDIYSIVYIETQGTKKTKTPFKLYQRIGTHAARDFEYFTFDGNHYLAVANEYTQVKSMDATTGRPVTVNDYTVNSVIYWWTGSMWVEWQRIPTNGAVKWSFFQSSFGHPMLVVANTKAPPVIFTYDPLRGIFVPTQNQDISPIPGQPNIIADVRSVMPFRTQNDVFLAVANYNPLYSGGFNIFKLNFEMRPVKKLEASIPEVITAHLEKMKVELEKLQLYLTDLLAEVADKVMTRSTEQNITSTVHAHNVTITGTLTTSNLIYRKHANKGPTTMSDHAIEILSKKLKEQEDRIKVLQAKYDDAVLLNQNATITGKKVLSQSTNVQENLVSNEIQVSGLIDGTKLNRLQNETLKKSLHQVVHGNYTFKDVTMTNADVGTINGDKTSSFMTTNTEQVITGAQTFNDTVTVKHLDVGNFSLNGLNIPEDIVTKKGNVTISGKKDFSQVVINRLDLNGVLNQVNLSTFNRSKMTLYSDQHVGRMVLNDGFSSSASVLVNGNVDGVNLTEMSRTKSEGVETVSGRKTFRSIIVKKHMTISNLNGLLLDNVVTLNTPQVISGPVTFKSDVNITGNVNTNSTVNNLHMSSQLVTKLKNHMVGGHKTITNQTYLQRDLNVLGRVDGVNIGEWNSIVVRMNTKQPVTGKKNFLQGLNVTNQLRVRVVNNQSMLTLRDDLVTIDDQARWKSRFEFENLTVNELRIGEKLKGYRVPRDFIPLRGGALIKGVKNFNNMSIAGNLSLNGRLSGRNFSKFHDDVFKNNTNEKINSDVHFLNALDVDTLNVSGLINNLSIPNDVITTNTHQNMNTTLTFTNHTTFADVVHSHHVVVNQTVNGIDISEMEANAIHKDRNQTVNATIIFVGGIDCKQNLTVGGLINGVNLTELMQKTVRISRPQNISGHKIFTQDVTLRAPLTSPGEINGVHLRDLESKVLKRKGNQTIHSKIVINGNLSVGNVTTNGNPLNGIDFKNYISNAAKSGVHNTIVGNVTFKNGLSSNTMTTSEAVDGVNVSNVLLSKFNQTVNSPLNFAVVTAKDVKVVASLDGVDVQRLQSKSLKLQGQQNITANYSMNGLQFHDELIIDGKINLVNLTELDSTAMHLSGDEVVTGNKQFQKVTVNNVTITGKLNGANVSLIYKDALRKSGDQKVCQKKTFRRSVFARKASIKDILVAQTINGVNMKKLVTQAVRLNGNKMMNGHYHFRTGLHVANNLTVQGKLNNRSVPGDFMTTYGNQTVTGNKTLHASTIFGHLTVTGSVDGVDVRHLNDNRISLSGDQVLNGVHFTSVHLEGDLLLPNMSTVNHIDLSTDLLSVGRDSVIRGTKTFNSTQVVGNITTTSGVVNGVNLTDFSQKVVLLTSSSVQKISADQTFKHDFNVTGNMTVEGLVNGVKLTEKRNYSNDISATIKKELSVLSMNAQYLCNATTNLMPIAVTERVLTGIEKKDVYKTFAANSHLGSIHSTAIGENVFISVARAPGASCGPAYILKCNKGLDCKIHQVVYTNAPKLEFFVYETFDALLVSHWNASESNNTLGCKLEPEIYVFNRILGKFFPYQTLNKVLFDSYLAPVIASSSILTPYLGALYVSYQSSTPRFSSSYHARHLPLDIKWFQRAGRSYLAVGGYEESTNYVDILFISGVNLGSLKREQRIKANGRHVAIGTLMNNQTIIATSADGLHGSIQLYAFNEMTQKFEFYQRLPHSASSVKIQSIQSRQYLFYASPTRGFGICEWLGVSGFGGCVRTDTTDTVSVDTIITAAGAYAITGTDNSLVVYRTMFKGNNNPYRRSVC